MSNVFAMIFISAATAFMIWFAGPKLWFAIRTGKIPTKEENRQDYDRDHYPFRYCFVVVTLTAMILIMIVATIAVFYAVSLAR